MASPFNLACRQLSGVAATAASTCKDSIPAIPVYAKDEEIMQASAMSTDRTFQIAQNWQSSNVLLPQHVRKHH
jgi:hypothetical protein